MHMCVSSLMNVDSMPAIDLRQEAICKATRRNLKDTSSVTRQILQQSPFSTAC